MLHIQGSAVPATTCAVEHFMHLTHLAPPYLAELCRPVVHLTGRRHLQSDTSSKLDVQQTATAIGRRNFAVSGPETWNSLPAELRLSTLSTHSHLCTTPESASLRQH